MGDFSALVNSQSLGYVEDLYARYLEDPASVPESWRQDFDRLRNGNGHGPTAGWNPQGPFPARSIFNPAGGTAPPRAPKKSSDVASKQERVDQLIRNYRVRGHILSKIDPLGTTRPAPAELDPAFYGFSDEDLDRELSTTYVGGPDTRTLRGLIRWLQQTYCRSIAAQFMHIDSLQVRMWLQDRMEGCGNRLKLGREEQLRILKRLADAVVFEEFLAKKFVGAKSFGLEGAESLIPLLDMAIEKAGNEGTQEIVIGMAHRGRLNVLANIMGKSPSQIFREFDDSELKLGGGDVKYHLGYSSNWTTSKGHTVHLSLCFNPSHLEFVNTVAQGRVRAKQDRFKDFNRERGAVLLIHGDAAFAGEGIIQETLNLSELDGYKIGGTIHVIVNNQVGFTTSPEEGRSTTYATDVAKMLQIPILHVNGEDPEAVAQVITLALDFRKKFQRDVVIDMYCYRRKGHNESDEPEFTQPLMYQQIRQRPSVYAGYLDHLINFRSVQREEAEQIVNQRRQRLDEHLAEARSESCTRRFERWGGVWSGYYGGKAETADQPQTGIDVATAQELLALVSQVPSSFSPHAKATRLLTQRLEMAQGKTPLDWGAAEMLAFGSLLDQAHPLRMSGQDVRRGTFSHRHAVVYDYNTGVPFHLLSNIVSEPGYINIHNSPLSEAGVLGFEYGYSLDCPEGLVVWEAQFGDFCNAAQVIIDQFIASAEDKWDRLSNLVMLLPHGFEGQGPEHSSARLERFLALTADDNMQIAQPSTPAQYFHLLRRQVLRRWKKPLVVMTPKSLLRLPDCSSTLAEFSQGTFQPVLADPVALDPRKVRKILLCSGKVYYELAKRRTESKDTSVAIVRLEEFYPFPAELLSSILDAYPDGTPVVWVQDEPQNMGAWPHLRMTYCTRLLDRYPFSGVTREASASPATGSHKSHHHEQHLLLDAAFA